MVVKASGFSSMGMDAGLNIEKPNSLQDAGCYGHIMLDGCFLINNKKNE
ncbi:MAG: hypothetical protein WCK92_14885 [Bacteroidota bacterium]